MRRRRATTITTAAAATILSMMVVAAPARAQQPPSDIVVLTSGDRLTGEIKLLSRGRLSFDVKATGVISIDWEYVAEVTSASLFEVETNEGAQLLGTLAQAGPGKLALVDVSRPVGVRARGHRVDRANRRSFLRRLDGAINVGGSYTQSSGVAQISFAFDVKAGGRCSNGASAWTTT